MENSLLVIFGKFWLKIRKKINFDWNQLKLATQHKYMYMYQKTFLKWRILFFLIVAKFG